MEIHPAGDARRPFLRGGLRASGDPRGWRAAVDRKACRLSKLVSGYEQRSQRPCGDRPRGGTTLGLDYRKEDPVAKVLVLDVGVRPGC